MVSRQTSSALYSISQLVREYLFTESESISVFVADEGISGTAAGAVALKDALGGGTYLPCSSRIDGALDRHGRKRA